MSSILDETLHAANVGYYNAHRNRPLESMIEQVGKPVETTFALFLGGPIDGKRLPVPADRRVRAITVENVVTLYREEKLAEPEESRIRLFVADGMSPAAAVARLIAGYPRS